jgi:hypothetical protein
VENDASSRLAKQTRSVWNAARFPDLATKTIWKSRTLLTPSGESINAGASATVGHTAVGNPGSNKRVRSIDLHIRARHQSKLPAPDFLREVVQELMELDGFTVDLMTDSEDDGWTIPIALLADEEGEIDIGLFVETGDCQLRERRVAIFSIAQHVKRIHFVAIEDSPTHVKLYLTSENSPNEIWQTVRGAASDFIAKREPKQEYVAQLLSSAFDL